MSSRSMAEAHIHLDPIGGIAGDMMVAALLDARPDLADGLEAMLARAGLPPTVKIAITRATNGGVAGTRFVPRIDGPAPHAHGFAQVRRRIEMASLDGPTRDRALAMLDLLGAAEARVHGIALTDVHFHELAGWDTVVDLLAAAWLIEALSPASWSVGPLPLGGGTIEVAHGLLPVPAPATAELLAGFTWHDDGVPGERVTPTGAAILRQLQPVPRPGLAMRLVATGWGLGSRTVEGRPNALRALLFEPAASDAAIDRVGVLRFEIDDQTAEDLALGLDRLRGVTGVIDVCQWPMLMKRGRLATAVQVLCDPAALDAIAEACLAETATLGVRSRVETRRILARDALEVMGVAVKLASRPGGATAKAELRDLERAGGAYGERQRLRRAAEREALEEP